MSILDQKKLFSQYIHKQSGSDHLESYLQLVPIRYHDSTDGIIYNIHWTLLEEQNEAVI